MKKRISGFTLIEALLGLLIFSIIAVSLYGVFQSGIQINRRSDDGNQIYREIRWSLDRITKDLEGMVSYDFSVHDPERTAFAGSGDVVSFITAAENGLKTVSYSLRDPEEDAVYKVMVSRRQKQKKSVTARYEEKDDIQLLVRTQRDFAGTFQPTTETQESQRDILSPHVKTGSLKFSYAYYEGSPESGKIVWRDTWHNKYIPSGVRVEITFVKNDKTKAPVTVRKNIYIPTGYLGQ